MFVAALFLSSAARAHDTWLTAQAPDADRPHWSLLLTTGHEFPALGSASRPQRVARAQLFAGARAVPLLPASVTAEALPFRVVVGDESVMIAVVALHPLDTTLSSDVVAVYVRDELGGEASILERYRKSEQWRERYTKNAKAIIRRSGRSADPQTTRAHGLPYELVPSIDPTLRAPGEALTVCARADGAAITGAHAPIHIGLIEADRSVVWQRADGAGCATFSPATAAGFLLRSVLLRPVERSDLDWESHFASLTVHDAVPIIPKTENSP